MLVVGRGGKGWMVVSVKKYPNPSFSAGVASYCSRVTHSPEFYVQRPLSPYWDVLVLLFPAGQDSEEGAEDHTLQYLVNPSPAPLSFLSLLRLYLISVVFRTVWPQYSPVAAQ